MIAIGLEGGYICLVDADTGEIKWKVHAHDSPHTSVAISPDGRWIASVGMACRQWKLWNSIDGTLSMAVPSHDGHGECTCGTAGPILEFLCPLLPMKGQLAVKFSPCNSWVACGSRDGNIALWDIRTEVPQLHWHLETASKQFDSLSFSRDGSLIACGGYQAKTYIVDVETGTLRQSWKSHAGGTFSPINNNLLATGTEYAVSLWDVERETIIWTQTAGHAYQEAGNFATFSPDGLTIATVSQPTPDEDSDQDDESTDEPPRITLIDATTGDVKQMLVHEWSLSVWDSTFSVSPYI